MIQTQRASRDEGFTIVELLIVIIVIAILAALTIVSYNGVVARAIEASVKSDLQNAQTVIEAERIASTSYAADVRTVNSGKGLQASGSNQLLYLKMGTGYCIAAMNPTTGAVWHTGSTDAQLTQGGCNASVQVSQPPQQISNGAWGIGFDANDTMYVRAVDNKIYSISKTGTVTFIAGAATTGYSDGTGAAAQFNGGDGRIAIDGSGNIIVADEFNKVIRKVTPAGVVSTIAGIAGSTTSVDGVYGVATINRPNGVWVDSSGIIYVGDTYGSKVRKVATDGSISTLKSGVTQAVDLAVDSSGSVYVTSSWTNYVQKVTAAGVMTTLAGSSTAGNLDGLGAAARFSSTNGVAVDASGNVFVSDKNNKLIRVINPGGAVFTLAGTGVNGLATGSGTTAQFSSPSALTFDSTGALYVAQPWAANGMRKLTL